MNRLIYTVNVGGYDTLKDPLVLTPNTDYVCFTDDPTLESNVWAIELLPKKEDVKRQSRRFKLLPLPGYDQTLYVDASFRINHDLTRLLEHKRTGIWLFNHPQRCCAYEEARIVLNKNLDDPATVINQINRYEQEGFPKDYGLWRCGVMIRDHRQHLLNYTWWNEIEQGSWRDQISFPYACWKTNTTPRPILANLTDYYFSQSLHKPYLTDNWKYVGEGEPPEDLRIANPLVHLIVTAQGMYFPKWLNNYISLQFGKEKFIQLAKALNAIIVYERG